MIIEQNDDDFVLESDDDVEVEPVYNSPKKPEIRSSQLYSEASSGKKTEWCDYSEAAMAPDSTSLPASLPPSLPPSLVERPPPLPPRPKTRPPELTLTPPKSLFSDTFDDEALSWTEAVDFFSEQKNPTQRRFFFPLKRKDHEFASLRKHYDPCEPTHWRLLKTVYETLCGTRCPGKIGPHWETLGFQGSDPRTDLNRSKDSGCLALVQLLYLAEAQPDLARDLYSLANTPGQDWPLACTSLLFTSDALRDIKKKKKKTIESLHDLYTTKFQDFKQRLSKHDEDRFISLNRARGKTIIITKQNDNNKSFFGAGPLNKKGKEKNADTMKKQKKRMKKTDDLFDSIMDAEKTRPPPKHEPGFGGRRAQQYAATDY